MPRSIQFTYSIRPMIIYRLDKMVVFSFILDPLLVLIEYVPYGDLLGYLRKSRGLSDTYFNDPDRKPDKCRR